MYFNWHDASYLYLTFGKVNMGSSVLRSVLWLKITHELLYCLFIGSDQVNGLHSWQRLTAFFDGFHNCNLINKVFMIIQYQLGFRIENRSIVSSCLLVIPSAESSCILVQADTIFIDCISTINTRHSSFPGALFKAVVARMTSFMISEVQNYAIIRISFQSMKKYLATTSFTWLNI